MIETRVQIKNNRIIKDMGVFKKRGCHNTAVLRGRMMISQWNSEVVQYCTLFSDKPISLRDFTINSEYIIGIQPMDTMII